VKSVKEILTKHNNVVSKDVKIIITKMLQKCLQNITNGVKYKYEQMINKNSLGELLLMKGVYNK
jgi:hypothetical protein